MFLTSQFYVIVVFYLALLGLYAVVVLNSLPSSGPTGSEVALAVWMAVMILEESRQVASSGVIKWFGNLWNRLDLFMVSKSISMICYKHKSLSNATKLYSLIKE